MQLIVKGFSVPNVAIEEDFCFPSIKKCLPVRTISPGISPGKCSLRNMFTMLFQWDKFELCYGNNFRKCSTFHSQPLCLLIVHQTGIKMNLYMNLCNSNIFFISVSNFPIKCLYVKFVSIFNMYYVSQCESLIDETKEKLSSFLMQLKVANTSKI